MIVNGTPLELNPRVIQICIEAAMYAQEQHPDDFTESLMCQGKKIALLVLEECANNVEIRREIDTNEDYITFNIGSSIVTAAKLSYPE